MSWAILIRKNGKCFQHTTEELHAALAVAYLLLRNGMQVDWIEGTDGLRISTDAIHEISPAVVSAERSVSHRFIQNSRHA